VKPRKVNLEDRFSRFDDLRSPKIIGVVKDDDLKRVKVRGGLVWHQHDDTTVVQGWFLVRR
jgi:hypothetical protein